MDEVLNISEEDFRRIVSAVRTASKVDLIHYEPLLLCHRFERFMQMQGYSSVSVLIEKIMQDRVFVDILLNRIRVQTTEMFRDPQMWRELEQNVFPRLRGESVIKIWVPDVCGDDELNTLLIMLDRNDLLSKSMVYATSAYAKVLADVKIGQIDAKKLEISLDNYSRLEPNGSIEGYFERLDKYTCFSSKLLSNVIFIERSLIFDNPPDKGFNLVLFRNRALNYSQYTRKSIIEKLYKSMIIGGYFILGIGENLKGLEQVTNFVSMSKTENIFRKL